MLATERFGNVQRSLYNYIEQNFTESAKDYRESNSFDSTVVNDWVWFGIASVAPRYIGFHSQGTTKAEKLYISLQTIINVKPGSYIIRMSDIRDAIVNLLRRPSITVTDYVGGGGSIGKLIGQGLRSEMMDNRIRAIPGSAEEDIQRWIMMFDFEYISIFDA